jgi:hypothetical protein
MSFSTLTTTICRLLVGSILALLLVIGMALSASAMSTTATSGAGRIAPGALTSAVFQLSYGSIGGKLNSVPPDPGCQGANAHNPACLNNSGSTG